MLGGAITHRHHWAGVMSDMTLSFDSTQRERPLVWLQGAVRSPPFSLRARREAGFLLRRLQRGESLAMPHARPMPVIAPRCLELRILDDRLTWRIILRTDPDAIVILDVFAKKTPTTPTHIIEQCRRRLRAYDAC